MVLAEIDVSLACGYWSHACPDADTCAQTAARAALAGSPLAPPGPVELCVSLIDDARQRQLNREYRGLDRPTNVLAFPAWQPGASLPPGSTLLLGDVVLAFETVAREAAEQQKPFADHLRHLVVHGVLHLLGHDHQGGAEAAEMEALESSILAALGVPDPYRDTI